MAGDPDLKKTESLIYLLEECGADIIELGVPFSDPLADGPTIQRAAERALRGGTTLTKVISLVASVRKKTGIPIVLMTYYNPVFKYGEKKFVADAVKAGVDGAVIPDLPPDEAEGFIRETRAQGFATIFLLAPTSTKKRIRLVARKSSGYIYYVSMTGITGARLKLDSTIEQMIRKIRTVSKKPVCVGFGVSNPREARAVAGLGDGVIIGSAIVRTQHATPSRLRKFLVELRKAI